MLNELIFLCLATFKIGTQPNILEGDIVKIAKIEGQFSILN